MNAWIFILSVVVQDHFTKIVISSVSQPHRVLVRLFFITSFLSFTTKRSKPMVLFPAHPLPLPRICCFWKGSFGCRLVLETQVGVEGVLVCDDLWFQPTRCALTRMYTDTRMRSYLCIRLYVEGKRLCFPLPSVLPVTNARGFFPHQRLSTSLDTTWVSPSAVPL